MENNNGCHITIGGWFASMLTVLFIGLKLTGYINWSWVWVLCPLWASAAFSLVFMITLFILYIWLGR